MTSLRIQNLTFRYPGQAPILRDVSLDVAAGERVAILGMSGGGKSTLLKLISGLIPSSEGAIQVDRRPGNVGYIPQRLGLIRHATALENVLQGSLHKRRGPWSWFRKASAEDLDQAMACLAAVRMDDLADRPIHLMSGGQQRRVATARTLHQRPQLLLADEFLGELDPTTVDLVQAAVRKLCEEQGTAMVFVEHHLDQAWELADRVLELRDGKLVEVQA